MHASRRFAGLAHRKLHAPSAEKLSLTARRRPTPTLSLVLLPTGVAVCRLAVHEPVPAWSGDATQFLTVSRTATELSIIADEHVVPPTISAQRGYRLLRVEGPLPLTMVGVIAALATPLAEAGVPLLGFATYDTDYLLVRGSDLAAAIAALRRAGHLVTDHASG